MEIRKKYSIVFMITSLVFYFMAIWKETDSFNLFLFSIVFFTVQFSSVGEFCAYKEYQEGKR